MADYNAILRRTLDGLGETTPQLRAKLFDRARITIARQLEAAKPPMSAEAIAEQKAHLEAAIASIENEYMAGEQAPVVVDQPVDEPPAAPPRPREEPTPPTTAAPVAPPELTKETFVAEPGEAAVSQPVAQPAIPDIPEPTEQTVGIPPVEDDYSAAPVEMQEPVQRSGNLTTIIIALASLLIIGGGVAALWTNRDSLGEAYQQLMSSSSKPARGDSPAKVSTVKNDEKLPASSTVETVAVEKMDQRLSSEGKEIAAAPIPANNDTLPAGLEPSPVTTTRIIVPDASGSGKDTQTVAAASTENAAQASTNKITAIVAQKSLLYEEGAAQGKNSVDAGTVVWSIVQEAPGEGMPLEPAIRAKAEIAKRGLVLTMTIKRNRDRALPASHIIELVFSVPKDFSGGAIDKVQRFVFKENEQARGEALVGVPATIADGIFLIALNNLPEAVKRNNDLMKGRDWIDIPLGYRTGRRALITLEKGVPGDRVFKEVFAAWAKAG